jgi:hypothetical protein
MLTFGITSMLFPLQGVSVGMHFYLYFPLFDDQCNTMFAAITSITNVTLDVCLYGDPIENNKKVFDAVHALILKTKRFDI